MLAPDHLSPAATGDLALLPIFNALPGAYLLLSPALLIEAATDEYLAATLTRREQLLGRYVFDAFPDNPQVPEANAVHNLRASFEQVLATGQPHEMPVQHYDVPDPDQPGRFVERHWLPRNTPVLDAAGRVQHIIHAVVNVTDRVQAESQVQAGLLREQAAEAEAERQHNRLEQFFRQAPAAICVLDGPELVFELVNPAYQRLFPGRALVGKPLLEALPELANHSAWATLQRVYQTGETHKEQSIRIPLARHDSALLEDRYFNYIQQPRYDEHGRIDGVLVFAFEVTEQAQAQQRADALQAEVLAASRHQMQERETFYRVFEQTPAAICFQRGPEHRYTYVNPAYQALFPDRKFVGRSVVEALPEVTDQGFVALLDGVYATGKTFYGTELPVTLAGSAGQPARVIYFNFTYQAYQEDGQTVGISTFAYDVTEQVLARRLADQQRQLLHQLFMEVPAPIVILDGPELVYQLVNPAYQRIFPGRVLLGKPLLEALPELVGTPIPDILHRVYATGETYVAHNMPLQLARYENGPLEEIYWTFTYQARRNGRGAVDGVMVFAYEVTEQVRARQVVEENRRQALAMAEELARANEGLHAANEEARVANEELAAANAQLTRVNVDLDNFVYTASHDLKAPISNIEGLLHVLQEQLSADHLEPEVAAVLGMMQNSVDRFKRTIGHLSDVLQLQKEHDRPVTTVPLAAVLDGVRLDLQPLLQQTGARLDVDVAACPQVRFAEKNLRSIVYNLLSNALKYRHPGRPPHVRIGCHQDAQHTVLSVHDNGLGLAPAQQTELFGMFRRLHGHVEGTGIGLYMVKRILDNAGGPVEVASEPGVGSTFTVYFPR